MTLHDVPGYLMQDFVDRRFYIRRKPLHNHFNTYETPFDRHKLFPAHLRPPVYLQDRDHDVPRRLGKVSMRS